MSKAKHTPGPWTLDKGRMVLGPCWTGELKAICERVRGGSPQQVDANARLIAAAPELLQACKAVLIRLDYCTQAITDLRETADWTPNVQDIAFDECNTTAISFATAAIAKAERTA